MEYGDRCDRNISAKTLKFLGPFLTGLKRGEFRENLCVSGVSGIFGSYQIIP